MNILKTVCLSTICLLLFVFLNPFLSSAAPLDDWHVRNSVPGGYSLNAVAYGNGMFVAVGSGGTILSSPDGTNWTARPSGTTAALSGVTYGNGLFLAVGDAGTILTSSDGLFWTPRSSGTSISLQSVAYGNGLYVALSGGIVSVTSPDGVQWTVRNSIAIGWITFGDEMFLAPGFEGGLYVSQDGMHWTSKPIGWPGAYYGISVYNGRYVLAGANGAPGFDPVPLIESILTSSDGTNWIDTFNGAAGSYAFLGITHGNGYFVAVGPPGKILSSPDGYVWTSTSTSTTSWMSGITYGNRTFVAVGHDGLILQSDLLNEAVGVPTLSEWGMLIFMVVSGLAAMRSLKMRGQQKT